MITETERQAVAEFPELQRLIDLRDAGWFWLPPRVDDGHVVEVHGVRTWLGGWADAIRVRFTTDAAGLRVDHEGGVVWRLDGGLTEVVDQLVALSPPGSQNAPRLVKSATGGLWTPGRS